MKSISPLPRVEWLHAEAEEELKGNVFSPQFKNVQRNSPLFSATDWDAGSMTATRLNLQPFTRKNTLEGPRACLSASVDMCDGMSNGSHPPSAVCFVHLCVCVCVYLGDAPLI